MTPVTFDLEDVSVAVPGAMITLTGVGERTPWYRKQETADGLYLRSVRTRDPQGFV